MGNVPSTATSEEDCVDINRISLTIIEDQKRMFQRVANRYATMGDILGFVIPAGEARRAIYYSNDSNNEKIRCLTNFDIYQAIESVVKYPFVIHHSRQGYVRVLYVHQPKTMTSL